MTDRGKRERLPRRRKTTTYEFTLGGTKMFLNVGTYPNGVVGEIFLDLGQAGAFLKTTFQAWAISISKALQYGVPIHELLDSYLKVSTPTDPNGVLLCTDLPAVHKKSFKSPWQAIASVLLEITDKEGRLKA